MPLYKWDDDTQEMKIIPGSYRYRSKWACFNCRVAFTRTVASINDVVKCPNCKNTAIDMGHLFEAPPKRNKRKWSIMEILGNHGVRFNRAGNVAFINYMITGKNKLSPNEVRNNIISLINKSRRFRK